MTFREQFAELFDEKARELNRVEAEYSECKLKLEAANRRLVDCDYKGIAKFDKGSSINDFKTKAKER